MTAAGGGRRRGAGRVALWLVLSSGAAPAVASAQVYIGRDLPRAGSIQVSGGGTWTGGYEQGSVSAEETRNTGSGPFVLFAADSRVAAAAAAHGRFGVYLSRSASVEAGVLYGRPRVSSRLSGDAEGAVDLTAEETLTRIVVAGSLVVHLTQLAFAGGRGAPFVLGGGGYIRELHEKNEVVETGNEYHAGTGVNLWFGRGKRRTGLRADVGLSMRTGGADGVGVKHTVPTAGVSLAFLF